MAGGAVAVVSAQKKHFVRARRQAQQEGQSVVEFTLAVSFFLAFMIFSFRMTLLFSFGSFVHYATFMAARAYLSAGPNQQDQEQRASHVLSVTVKNGQADRFAWLARGANQGVSDIRGAVIGRSQQFIATDSKFSWMQGVTYSFTSNLFLIPLTANGQGPSSAPAGAQNQTLSLRSESWLGREPTTSECIQFMTTTSTQPWEYDNGC